MKKYIILGIVVITLSVAIFGGTGIILAAEDSNSPTGGDVVGNITASDLGIANVGTLPTSRFYFLKEWRRGISRFFAFTSIAKAELESKIANEKATEILKVAEASQGEEAIVKSLENYKKSQERLVKKLESLKETSQNPNIDRLLTMVAEREVFHVALFDEIAQKTKHDTVKNSISNIRARVAQEVVVASEKDTPEKFAKKIENAIKKLPGGELKHIRSVEMIDFFEENSSEDVKESLREIRGEFQEKLAKDIEEFINNQSAVKVLVPDGDNLSDQVSAKIIRLPGDIVRHLIILNEIKESAAFNPKEYSITKVNAKRILDQTIESLDKVLQEDKNIAQKAEEQIKRAKDEIKELESKLAEFVKDGVSGSGDEIERQTPKRDFGDRMKAGLDQAGGMLANANNHLLSATRNLANGKFGEAFGQARSAEVLARNGLRFLDNILRPDTGGLENENRVFPETNNRTACDDRQEPGCLRGEILECRNGKWICIGPATGVGRESQTTPPSEGTKPIERIICSQEYNPVCGINGKTYSNECMAKSSGMTIKYKGECSASSTTEPIINTTPKSINSEPAAIAPTTHEFKLEADDNGFYPDSTLTVPKGSRVKIHFIVRASNVYYGGLDFRSSKFKTESIKPGATADVEFTADESFVFTSYWPLSGVQKSSGKVVVQ